MIELFWEWIKRAGMGWYESSAFEQLNFLITIIGFAVTGWGAFKAYAIAKNIQIKINLLDDVISIENIVTLLHELAEKIRLQNVPEFIQLYPKLNPLLLKLKHGSILEKTAQESLKSILEENVKIDIALINMQNSTIFPTNFNKNIVIHLRGSVDLLLGMSATTKKKMVIK